MARAVLAAQDYQYFSYISNSSYEYHEIEWIYTNS